MRYCPYRILAPAFPKTEHRGGNTHPTLVNAHSQKNHAPEVAGPSHGIMQTPPENFPSGAQPFSTPATLDPFEIEDEIQPEYFHIGGGPFFHGTSRRAARKF